MRIIQEAFVLDERYRNFLVGKTKSQPLYHSNENNEPSLLQGFIIFLLGALIFLAPFFIVSFALGSFYSFQAFGVETEAIITVCNDKRIEYIYEVDGQAFRGYETLGDYLSSGYTIGQSFKVLYLVYAPQQNVRPDSVWGGFVFLLLIFPFLLLCAGVFAYKAYIQIEMSIATYQRFQRLRKGILLTGEVTHFSFGYNFYKHSNGLASVNYRFFSPDGKTLYGYRSCERADMDKETELEEGTPVMVLYADDDCHMLL